jgi:hypothetical protein
LPPNQPAPKTNLKTLCIAALSASGAASFQQHTQFS